MSQTDTEPRKPEEAGQVDGSVESPDTAHVGALRERWD